MNEKDAEEVVKAAIAKGLANYGGYAATVERLAIEASTEMEFNNLAKIYMAELSDWTIQLAYMVGDGNWRSAMKALPPANLALQKLAGVVGKLMEK